MLEIISAEPTQEQLDIKEMSAFRVKKFEAEVTTTLDAEKKIPVTVPINTEITVMQSVRNPGNVIVHLADIGARLFGPSKCWTEQKIYQAFGKTYTPLLQEWDKFCILLAMTDIPAEEKLP